MMSSVLPHFCKELDLEDIAHLGLVNRDTYEHIFGKKAAQNNELWRFQYIKDYGDVWTLARKVASSSTHFFKDFVSTYLEEPKDFYSTYKARRTSLEKEFSYDEKKFEEAADILEKFNLGEASQDEVYYAVNIILDIIHDYPMAVNAYCQLAITAFILNNYEVSFSFLCIAEEVEASLSVQNHKEFISVMKEKIEKMIEKENDATSLVQAVEDEVGAVFYEPSFLFREALRNIFKQLDQDHDGLLNFEEFQDHLSKTSSNVINKDIFKVIVARYNENGEENLTVDGFIQMYMEQALNDEEEARKDLEVYGYDKELIVKRQYAVPRVA
jgi:hypothetical protein